MNWNFVYQNASYRGYRNFVYLSNFWPQGVQKFCLLLKNRLPQNTEISSTSKFSQKYTKSQCFGRRKFNDLVDNNSVILVDDCSVYLLSKFLTFRLPKRLCDFNFIGCDCRGGNPKEVAQEGVAWNGIHSLGEGGRRLSSWIGNKFNGCQGREAKCLIG